MKLNMYSTIMVNNVTVFSVSRCALSPFLSLQLVAEPHADTEQRFSCESRFFKLNASLVFLLPIAFCEYFEVVNKMLGRPITRN